MPSKKLPPSIVIAPTFLRVISFPQTPPTTDAGCLGQQAIKVDDLVLEEYGANFCITAMEQHFNKELKDIDPELIKEFAKGWAYGAGQLKESAEAILKREGILMNIIYPDDLSKLASHGTLDSELPSTSSKPTLR